jgi:hypothetical protein
VSDVRDLLRVAVGDERPPPDLGDRALATARRRERRRRLTSAAVALVAFAGLTVALWAGVRAARAPGPAVDTTIAPTAEAPLPTPSAPPTGPSVTPSPSPSESMESSACSETAGGADDPTVDAGGRPSFPRPFTPSPRVVDGTAILPVTFPDGSQAELRYPAELDLASRGVQPHVSYWFLRYTPPRHPIVFMHGDPDPSMFAGEEPVATCRTGEGRVEIWVGNAGTEGDDRLDRFLVDFRFGAWTVLVSAQNYGIAEDVAFAVHGRETSDGFVQLLLEPPIGLSDESGEGEGPELVFGDADPRQCCVRTDEEFRMIILDPHPEPCRREFGDSENVGGHTEFGAKCLGGPNDQGSIDVGVYGPAEFVQAVLDGLEARGVRYGVEG